MNLKVHILVFLLFLTLFLPGCTSKKNSLNEFKNLEQPEVELAESMPMESRPPITKDEQIQLILDSQQSKIEKMQSEIKLLQHELNQIQAYKEIWSEPLSIYNKKIILVNGSSIFGNIVLQDDNVLKVETLIGTIIIPKLDIIRIVDNYSDINDSVVGVVDILQSNRGNENNNYPNSAKIILLGDFSEELDDNFNTILSGRVKNIGKKRADFIKVHFTIYKDKQTQGSSSEFTVFINGETRKFDKEIISYSSLSEDSIGEFLVIIPSDFGPFTSYTYTMDWEQYD